MRIILLALKYMKKSSESREIALFLEISMENPENIDCTINYKACIQ